VDWARSVYLETADTLLEERMKFSTFRVVIILIIPVKLETRPNVEILVTLKKYTHIGNDMKFTP